MRSAPPSEKQLICCVRPGVLLVKASRFCWQSVLIALDFPAFERPAKALSGASEVGRPCGWFTDIRKRVVWSRAGDMIRNRRAMRVFAVHIDTCANHYDPGLGCDMDRFD